MMICMWIYSDMYICVRVYAVRIRTHFHLPWLSSLYILNRCFALVSTIS